METDILIPSLLRLLDIASIKRFKLKNKVVDFKDEIGQNAIKINNQIKSKHNIDIFNKSLSIEDLNKFEHLLGNAISNHVNKTLVPRRVNDEIQILKESKNIEVEALGKFEVTFEPTLLSFLKKIKSISINELLNYAKRPLLLSYLSEDNLTDHYFSLSKVDIEDIEYSIVFILRHGKGNSDKLSIVSFVALPTKEYSAYQMNPIQLFLKGLDKYGVDMKINNELSRYYKSVKVPLNTNFNSKEFLNLQNIGIKESFILAMVFTPKSDFIEMKNVFAIRIDDLIEQLNHKC